MSGAQVSIQSGFVWRGKQAAYLGAIGIEGGLCIVCLYGLCVEFEGLVPLLVLEGLVALVLELDSLSWRTPHGVSMEGGTGRSSGMLRLATAGQAQREGTGAV